MADSLTLELADFVHQVHTGIYSEETGQPQPLRFTVHARMKAAAHYDAATSLDDSKNYMDLKFACSDALGDTHFKLIEAVAEHVCETLFVQDTRVEAVSVKIVKLALSEADEQIGITLTRERRVMAPVVVSIEDLPTAPLEAAARFYGEIVPDLREKLAGAADLVIHFSPADHSHRGWRLAAVQELAREAAPKRVNGIVGGDPAGRDEVIAYLADAPGVTGQLLAVDGKSREIA